jgi:hypothetical protein
MRSGGEDGERLFGRTLLTKSLINSMRLRQ